MNAEIPDVSLDADLDTGVAVYDSYLGGELPASRGCVSAAPAFFVPRWVVSTAIADQLLAASQTPSLAPALRPVRRPCPQFHGSLAAYLLAITLRQATVSSNFGLGWGYRCFNWGLGSPIA